MSTQPEPIPFPPVDERLVAPESGFEVVDGKVIRVPPSKMPHARRHAKLASLLEAFVVDGHDVAVDLLTRTSELTDIAPDASVYAAEPDPVTGGRQLEELAFEVVSTQGLAHAGDRAARLMRRGVRRVFAIDVRGQRALEWSAATGRWVDLPPEGHIEDSLLVTGLAVDELVSVTRADNAVARALLARGNAVLEAQRSADRAAGRAVGLTEGRAEGLTEGRAEGLTEGRAEGLTEGRAEGRVVGEASGLARAVVQVLERRGLVVEAGARTRILGTTELDRLEGWLSAAVTCATVEDLLAGG